MPVYFFYLDYWFIVSFEYVIAAIGLYAVLVKGKLAGLQGSILGLFSVATLLFIYTSSKFSDQWPIRADTLRFSSLSVHVSLAFPLYLLFSHIRNFSFCTADSFLNLLEVPLFQSETLRDRSKTAVAGAIITATLNALTVFAAGYQA